MNPSAFSQNIRVAWSHGSSVMRWIPLKQVPLYVLTSVSSSHHVTQIAPNPWLDPCARPSVSPAELLATRFLLWRSFSMIRSWSSSWAEGAQSRSQICRMQRTKDK